MRRLFLVLGLALLLLALACSPKPEKTPVAAPTSGTTPGAPLSQSLGPALGSSPLGEGSSAQQTGLWVSGEGRVSAAPDVALLSLGIEAQEKTVAQAQEQARQAISRVRETLLRLEVAEKDIQTRHFSVQPVKLYPGEGREIIVGYRVIHLLQVKVRRIDQAGTIIDATAEAGGDLTRIDSISFTIDDPSPLYRQAREKAAQDALAKAKQIAELFGIELGRPTYISESTSYPVPPPIARFEVKAAPDMATPISPGELEISLTLQVNFSIKWV